QRIVLAEGTEERTMRAADKLIADGVADIILIGNPAEITAFAEANGLVNLPKATMVDPINNEKKETYANLLFELRKSKGMTIEQAQKLAENPLFLACLMIKNGDADGEVAGAANTTGDVLRPAFQIVKTAPGISVVSGAFLMFMPNKSFGDNGIMVFADCAVLPNPNAQELAQIAVSTARTTRAIAGIEPRVAMLSFSTKGSAKHEMVDKVVEATKLAQEMEPTMQIDGELQADAAIVEAVAASKAPGSPVAGKANVLVFPTLEVGNIAYKLVQRLAGAEAVGPILQGIAAPINDLSRGCSVDDIYKLVAITANQAIGIKESK
ncbi:MAG: phosphate acetyltransferase, partial [Bacteroidales bacterium]